MKHTRAFHVGDDPILETSPQDGSSYSKLLTARFTIRSIKCPAGPTKGAPRSSSLLPGASPTKQISAGTSPRRWQMLRAMGQIALPQPFCQRWRNSLNGLLTCDLLGSCLLYTSDAADE